MVWFFTLFTRFFLPSFLFPSDNILLLFVIFSLHSLLNNLWCNQLMKERKAPGFSLLLFRHCTFCVTDRPTDNYPSENKEKRAKKFLLPLSLLLLLRSCECWRLPTFQSLFIDHEWKKFLPLLFPFIFYIRTTTFSSPFPSVPQSTEFPARARESPETRLPSRFT